MKPNSPLDKHVAINTKQGLKTRLLILFTMVTSGLIFLLALNESGNTREAAQHHLNVATTQIKASIDEIAHAVPINALGNLTQAHLQKKMDVMRKHLGSSLYVINTQGLLLITDNQGGPFGTEKGQQLHNLPELSRAITNLTEGQQVSSYKGQGGQHLLRALALESPNTLIVGDIALSPWYVSLGGLLYGALFVAVAGFLLAHHWIKRAIKDWRRQNLSQTIMDSLTSFPNRRGMELFIQQTFSSPSNASAPNSLMLVSLDHFSQINIHYGTEAGDTILKQISSRIRSWLHPNDLIGRWDGDTFLVLHKGLSDINAASLAEKIVFEINRINFNLAGENVRISISIGVHTIDDPDTQRFSLAHTEQALRKAKKVDGHRIVHSNGTM